MKKTIVRTLQIVAGIGILVYIIFAQFIISVDSVTQTLYDGFGRVIIETNPFFQYFGISAWPGLLYFLLDIVVIYALLAFIILINSLLKRNNDKNN